MGKSCKAFMKSAVDARNHWDIFGNRAFVSTFGTMPQTILLVEDEAIISLAEARAIERFGYDVEVARTGEAAVELSLAQGKSIDLVLMDIDLGQGMDGTQAARRILAQRNLPIVFLSSHAERETVDKVRGITRYGYVVKNSGNFVLQSSIEMAFELFRAHEELRRGEARLATLLKTIPDLVWLKDTEGVYLACNPAFERFFGASEADIVGRTDYDFLPRAEADFFRGKDLEAIAYQGPHSNEEWITYSDGHRAFLDTIKTPMVDDQGGLVGVLGIGRDITERQAILDRLAESEAKVQQRLKTIVEPALELEELRLSEIIEIEPLEGLLEKFSALTGMVTALLDKKGEVLLATGWQDICTKFHRTCAESAMACTESDTFLNENLRDGEYLEYHCKNGLWDVVTPLYVDSRHVGNIFSGQYFHEDDAVDEAAFALQAERFSFDKEAYLDALRKVPRLSQERIGLLMDFLVRVTQFVSSLSFGKLQLERSIAERQRTERLLSNSVAEKETLYKELQHRVKNSLGIVSAFLSLNIADLEDERSRHVFQEAVDRVSCVSMIYDKLSGAADGACVELDVYLADLIDLLVATYAVDRDLMIEKELEGLGCDQTKTVSIGLILNELFTNALKYAHRPGEPGRISVRLSRTDQGAELSVSDDGPGLPPGFEAKSVKSLGLRIVGLLAGEIGGSLSFADGQGTTAIVRF